jgi:hypothetical protein
MITTASTKGLSFTYTEFPNTTVDTRYNTTAFTEDVTSNVAAIVGGVLAGLCLVIVLLVLVLLVLRRRTQQNDVGKNGKTYI